MLSKANMFNVIKIYHFRLLYYESRMPVRDWKLIGSWQNVCFNNWFGLISYFALLFFACLLDCDFFVIWIPEIFNKKLGWFCLIIEFEEFPVFCRSVRLFCNGKADTSENFWRFKEDFITIKVVSQSKTPNQTLFIRNLVKFSLKFQPNAAILTRISLSHILHFRQPHNNSLMEKLLCFLSSPLSSPIIQYIQQTKNSTFIIFLLSITLHLCSCSCIYDNIN